MKRSARMTRAGRGAMWRGLACAILLGLSACSQPPLGLPDASVIGFDGQRAVPPDCAALTRPSTSIDAGFERKSMQWGCATFTNLANQIANPRDLVAPQPLAPADAAVAASAVDRYQTGKITPLDQTTTRNSK